MAGAARRSPVGRRQLRRYRRWTGDDRRRFGADRLRRGHRDAGRASNPLRRRDDRGWDDAGRALRAADPQPGAARAPRADRPPPRPADGHHQRPTRPTLGRAAVQQRRRSGADLHRLRRQSRRRPRRRCGSSATRAPSTSSRRFASCARSAASGRCSARGGRAYTASWRRGALVDDLFLTIAPKLAGGIAPRILEGELATVAELELAWLLECDGELFARYHRR